MYSVRRFVGISTISLAANMWGPGVSWADQDAVLMQGDGVVVTAAEVLEEAERVPAEARAKVLSKASNVSNLASNLYVRRVFATRAEQEGLANDPKISLALRMARERMLSDAMVARIADAAVPSNEVLDRLAEAEYKAYPEKFVSPEQIRARHILIGKGEKEPLTTAEEILAELRGGADFEAVARTRSDDKGSAARGGDLGWFQRGKMVPQFEEAAFALTEPGQLSEIVRTDFGFHIIRLEERKAPETLPFADVRDKIRHEIAAKFKNEAVARAAKAIAENGQAVQPAIDEFARVRQP